ncbi:hypothetical protein HYY74_00060 [Candidatus Woesearchaeota archaeon]|nr:hypothetical protein [Candidatus Woesearchaeota archaeon]
MRIFNTGDVNIGSPTGGDKGSGTLNAVAVYDDNTLLTDWAFDLYFDGAVKPNDPYYRGQRLFSIAETYNTTSKERQLPWMPNRAEFEKQRSVGAMISRLWQGQEQQQMYIFELDEENRMLKEENRNVKADISALRVEMGELKAEVQKLKIQAYGGK